MLTVNGEKVWVPNRRKELVQGLRRMGVERIDDMPLCRVKKNELVKAYCRTRAQQLRRRQSPSARQGQTRRRGKATPKRVPMRTLHSQHFVAWSAPD